MNLFLYGIIFLTGIVFGSFYTLAVYRIPKREDITHTHSYCPNCQHKLGFFDLIPLFSYLFLRGKCHYCQVKIRPRYFIIECISGILFVCMAYLLGLKIEHLTVITVSEFVFFILYFTFIVLMAGIDKENRKINKPVLMYGIVLSIIYIIYLCIIENASIYRYGIYLVLYTILLLLDTITLKKHAKNPYVYGVLMTIFIMAIFTGEFITFNTVVITLLAIAIYLLLERVKNPKNRMKQMDIEHSHQISIGFILAVSNILYFIFALGYQKFLI